MKPTFKPAYHLLLLICCFMLAIPCYGATKYVSTSGNNSNSGNSWAQAWRTLQYAADQVNAGDSVWIADGNYAGFDLRTTGTAANPIVFIAFENSAVINAPNPVTTDGINIEDANYIEVNGVRVINQPRNGIRLVFADNCIVRNTFCDNNFERGIFTGFTDDILLEYNECLNSIDEHGIYVSNSSDRSIIRYNICHHNNRGGIQINADGSQGGDGISTDPEIYGNIIYENGVAGGGAINLDGVQGAFIYNNLLYENHATGIALFQQDGNEPSINADIVHNTIINASNARWCILAVNGSSGAQVFNNILINQHAWRGSIALDPDAVTGFDSDYNIVVNSLSNEGDGQAMTLTEWQALGYDANSMIADPLNELFVIPGSDYHLLNDAQAVDEGSAAFAFGINDDIEGTTRPQGAQHDIGAYEAEGSLAVEEEEETPDIYNPGININAESISWARGLNGTLTLMNVEGKVIARRDISMAGEVMLDDLVPGVYLATVHTPRGLQWSKGFVFSGKR
ncbi:MAG TPA: right-handed parallel beta-helix repeat-containing protein [Saprospiraceae bacterium]|nr:right-handed parallel beta-helix repeat-containing protein [Saprospiraceae bacterium]